MARTQVNLTPEQLTSLTLENFKAVTGHRFRMTRDQTKRQVTREQAFQEFVTTLRQTTPATTTAAS